MLYLSYLNNNIIILRSSKLVISLSVGLGIVALLPLALTLGHWDNFRLLVVFNILNWDILSLEFPVLLDKISLFFLFTVRLIGSHVYAFSFSYMRMEKYSVRFHILVARFVVSIYLLILSPHLVSVLVGWDGLGITSYLLVIYFQSRKSFNAGYLTAISNRVGDSLILISIGVMASQGEWLFGSTSLVQANLGQGTVLVLLAAITKRAQIPFSAWLPAAIAAPTPVSALVHSSTLVTAGVYLLIRFWGNLADSIGANLVFVLGRITMLLAGRAALTEIDIKKVVALSTLSQLGVIITTLGAHQVVARFFHLVSHAFFKALLFIRVGFIIHNANDYQDLRKVKLLPGRYVGLVGYFIVANLRLCGFPFLSGFYSKDLCIELLASNRISAGGMVLFYVATALTVAYTVRLGVFVYARLPKSSSLEWGNDYDKVIPFAGLGLTLGGVAGGRAMLCLFRGPFGEPLLSSDVKSSTWAVIILGVLAGGAVSWAGIRGERKLTGSYFAMWSLRKVGPLLRSHGLNSGANSRFLLDLRWTRMRVAAASDHFLKGGVWEFIGLRSHASWVFWLVFGIVLTYVI